MKLKFFLLIGLLIPLLNSCLKMESSLSYNGSLTQKITMQSMNRADITPSGRYVVGLTYNEDIYSCSNISQWDGLTGQKIRTYLPDNYYREDFWHFTSLAVSPDGKYVAGSGVFINMGRTYYLVLWDIETGKEVFSINPATNYSAMRFTPDGKKLYLMNGRDRFDIIEFLSDNMNYYKQDSLIFKAEDYQDHNRFYFTKDANIIYFDTPVILDLSKKPLTTSYYNGQSCAVYPDGKKMIVTWLKEIYVYNVKTLNKISSFIDEYVILNDKVVISPSGKYFITAYEADGENNTTDYGLQVFSGKDAKLITRIKDIYYPLEIKFIDDNRILVVSSNVSTIFNINE